MLARACKQDSQSLEHSIAQHVNKIRMFLVLLVMQGSGKTLAFGLPILQLLLAERGEGDAAADMHAQAGEANEAASGARDGEAAGVPLAGVGKRARRGGPLRALIMAPTRELAMQVQPCTCWGCICCKTWVHHATLEFYLSSAAVSFA